jgi:extracellular factor (EF) 3-hydroxypalmitic acid methyl ester biosynthesis protein
MTALSLPEVRGSAHALDVPLTLKVEHARPHSLLVRFEAREQVPRDGARFDRLTLSCAGRNATLGPCKFEAGGEAPSDGRLVFLEQVYDFTQLLQDGRISELSQRVRQLPLLWGRKTTVLPAFRDFTSQLLYDFQVYRSLFDELDRSLVHEPPQMRAAVHEVATAAEYGNFKAFFDTQLQHLARAVSHFTRQEHERHGFYFRKQMWDVILASEFLARTNLKPRGYAGDSLMMRMLYERGFRGGGLFAKFMHRHPIDTAAAQAVRNRRALIAGVITQARLRREPQGKTRVLSVACGPACELHEAVKTRDDVAELQFVLLDQDSAALDDARDTLNELEDRLGEALDVTLVRDSVRTLLRNLDLTQRWGRFDLIYSMGLFDYLTPPVAQAVLRRLYELLVPGGELLIGNFHPQNPSRLYMEYWMDWSIYYRDQREFLELVRELPDATSSLSFEETGSQMFLSVRKRCP